MIRWKISRHNFHQSEVKLKPLVTCLRAISRAQQSLVTDNIRYDRVVIGWFDLFVSSCLTWNEAQFERFSYILSNGYVLPAGM